MHAQPTTPERRIRAGVEVAVAQRVRESGQRAEIRIVALPLTGYRGMDGVMDVVIPLGGDPVAAMAGPGDQPRVVSVGFGDQRQRTAQLA